MSSAKHRLTGLFEAHFGVSPTAILEVPGDGSSRSYWRMVGPELETAIGAVGPDRDENRALFALTRTFRALDLPVPELYGCDEASGTWLSEDLGDTTLFQATAFARSREDGAFPESALALYLRAAEILARFQVEGGRAVDFRVCHPRPAYDGDSMLWDLRYFRKQFLERTSVPFEGERLEDDFGRLVTFLLEAGADGFMYRDFQSRNVMVQDGELRFIDFQGGRRGPPHYDIASLLYDAKAALPAGIRDRILAHYLDALGALRPLDPARFMEHYRGFVLIRIMQAMGAYGYRGFLERKSHFLQSVPYAARDVARVLEAGLPLDLPEVERVFGSIADRWAWRGEDEEGRDGLVLRIHSFGYKGGYPEDTEGHGGGFVFDCRAVGSPGHRLEYRELSGRDRAVAEALAASPRARRLWEQVRAMVDLQLQEYLKRGFTSLTVGFGSAAGQHRSVYFAERLARHVREHYPDVEVELTHREASSWPSPPGSRS